MSRATGSQRIDPSLRRPSKRPPLSWEVYGRGPVAANVPIAGPWAVATGLAAGRDGLVVRDEDTEDFHAVVRAHRLTGLAVRALDGGALRLNAEAAEKLHRMWEWERAWTGALDLEAQRIARAAAGSGTLTPPILLKGPAVSGRYRDAEIRAYKDIDLLIPTQEIDGWERLLRGLGFPSPRRWERWNDLRFTHHVVFRRPLETGDLVCEVHTRLFMERTARSIGYETLEPFTEPGPFHGLLRSTAPVQLVVLALHLLHHPAATRRLIWIRDLIELGDRDSVSESRKLAARWGVRWALETALAGAERLLEETRWAAVPHPPGKFGLRRAVEMDDPGHLYHLALARELGPIDGLRYLVSRFDPRRFTGSPLSETAAWASKQVRQAVTTPWHRGFR
jgi:hypothetical protein